MPNQTDLLENKINQPNLPEDPTAVERKKDHIDLAFQSQVGLGELDRRFYYEPMLAGHPQKGSLKSTIFLGKTLRSPIWVSSMTGGTQHANTINHNLARACQEFGMGMGLGSCRALLYSDDYLEDFAVRPQIGDQQPLYANLGIAQIEQLLDQGALHRMEEMLKKLEADGLIVHVNPMQEWLQPEGDRIQYAPTETISRLLDRFPDVPIIVKEVGQGFGRASLEALLQMPIEAIDFAASGGTNFAKLELLRSDAAKQSIYRQLAQVGHSAEDMVHLTNELLTALGERVACRQIIISGGVSSFLDGYYLLQLINTNAVYGQASAFLKHAMGSYEELQTYVRSQIEGLELAEAFLRLRTPSK